MLRNIFKDEPDAALEGEIDAVLHQMRTVGVDSDEYPRLMAYLERLHEIKAKNRRDPVSRDTMAIAAANLLGILVIVAYEQKHVFTSKGFTQILRPKTPKLDN